MTLRCDHCGWECEPGTLVHPKPGFRGKYRQGSVHVCQRAEQPGYGFMRAVEAATGAEEVEDG